MKKYLFSLGSVLLFFFAAAQTPVAYYPFTGNANDAIGSNHGTVNGATLTTDRLGNASSAYSFDGVNDKITAPIATTVTNNYSLTGWIKVNSIGTDQVLFYNGNSSLNGYGFYLSTTGTLYVLHGGINLYSTSFTITANQWIFLSLVQQSGNTKVYVNGTEVFNNSTSTPNAPTDLFYMSSNATGTEYFNGRMDEIKIFNAALTVAEVLSEYGANSAVNYQSAGSGDWSLASTWEVYNGTSFVPAASAPSFSDGIITVRSGHNVSINSGIAVDQLVIEPGAILNQNTDIDLANGAGTDISVSGTYNWNAGIMNIPGTMVVETGGVINLTSNVNYGVRAAITNNGTFNWLEGTLKFSNSPVITNNGQLNIACNRAAQPDFSGGTIQNTGTISKSSNASSEFAFGINIVNSGTFSTTGAIELSSSFTNTGILNLNAGNFNIGGSGVYLHNTGASITGTGSINNYVGVNINADLSLPAGITFNTASDFNISSGVTMTVNGTLNWFAANGGGTGANIILSPGAALNFPGANTKKLNCNITNNGIINWEDGQIRFSNNPVITNNGNLVIAGNNSTAPEFSSGSIVNNGIISKTSTGTTLFTGLNSFTNHSSGVIKGTGTINLSAGNYTNNGAIAPGNSPGILAIENVDPLLPDGNLQIEMLDGSGPGMGHDQLVRNSSLRLAGKLTVTETGTVPDGTYIIVNLTAGTITGYFDQIVLPAGYQIVVYQTTVQLIKGGPPVNPAQPGSGNAISFDGVNDVIQIPNIANDDFTYELWIKTSQVGPNAGSQAYTGAGILSGDLGTAITNDFVPMALNGNFISFGTGDADPNQTIFSTVPINDNKWHHVAVTRDKNALIKKIYIDGVENATGSCSNLSYNLNPFIYVGADFVDNVFFEGQLDEIRVWNIPLTQNQIRDRMCRKITNSDALYANLVAYYNHDETVGIITFDRTGNANDGSFINNPIRVTSGAAIGNASSHDYVNATKTASIAHASGESFTVTSASGNPDGIQVYRVDEQPNTLAGATGVGPNDKYFGVFQVNGTAPQYTAVYNYTGNPGLTPLTEPDLRLNKRTDNSVSSWTMLPNTTDESANTITVTGESTEYILGKLGAPLPLRLVSFYGSKRNNDALLQWTTVDEITTSRFEVQRSEEGVNFKTFTTVPAGSNDYSVSDKDVFTTRATAFYRLKSVDRDGRVTYSNSIKLGSQPLEILTIFPNPVQGLVSISGLKQNGVLKLYNADGKLLQQQTVRAQSVTIDMSAYAKGLYLLQYVHNGITVSEKMLKQ